MQVADADATEADRRLERPFAYATSSSTHQRRLTAPIDLCFLAGRHAGTSLVADPAARRVYRHSEKLRGFLHMPSDEERAAAPATEPDTQPEPLLQLNVGMRVMHDLRGFGRLVGIEPNDPRGPYHVQHESGEHHCYSKQAALKSLQPVAAPVHRFQVNPRYRSAALFAPQACGGSDGPRTLSGGSTPAPDGTEAAELRQLDPNSPASPATPAPGARPLELSPLRARVEFNRAFQSLTSNRRRWMDRTLPSASAAVSPATALLEAGERMHLLPRALHIARRDASVLDLSHYGLGTCSSAALAEAIERYSRPLNRGAWVVCCFGCY